MNRIKTERTIHDNKVVVKLLFDYDKEVVARVRAIQEVLWSRTMHCWYVAYLPQKIEALCNIGISVEQKNISNIIANDGNAELLECFSDHMKGKRYSEKTISRYAECLRIFLNFHSEKHYVEIDNNDITLFNHDCILAKKLSVTDQGQFVNAIKLFYEKISQKKIIIEQLECPRKGKPLPRIFSKDDVRIISATRNIKHKAMLSLIYSCGLWQSGAVNMRITDIDSKRQIINIRQAKGDKDRIATLSDKILQLLRVYFKQYRAVEWLFEEQIAGTQYTETSLNKVFQQAKNKEGVKMPFICSKVELTFGLFKHY